MNIGFTVFSVVLLVVGGTALLVAVRPPQTTSAPHVEPSATDVASSSAKESPTTEKQMTKNEKSDKRQTALLADGCFWCVEHDMKKVKGVISVVSGYAGGSTEHPTYENYVEGGHREVVLVTYNPDQVQYANLVEHIIKHGDPTDANGSFHDRGLQYAPAIYYENVKERLDAREVIAAVDAKGIFSVPLPLQVIPRVPFWPAEEYHQDYATKNPIRYGYYRSGSGRDLFIQKYWGDRADLFTFTALPAPRAVVPVTHSVEQKVETAMPWKTFVKPAEATLRTMLSPLQYNVTQEKGTEKPFDNLYDKNFEEGIYVDIVSGEPLYSSKDKYDSGTGWPSFVKPLSPDAVVLKDDSNFFSTRTEVRSRYADSHLGHVFDDGPLDRGGKRYCMNSAALRFVSRSDMEREGYAYLVPLLEAK